MNNELLVQDVVEQLNALDCAATLGSGGRRIRVNCPFCRQHKSSPDTKQHLYISTYFDFCLCYRCGWKGNYRQVEQFLPIKLPFKSDQTTSQTLPQPTRFYSPEEITLPPHLSVLNGSFIMQPALAYLREHNIDNNAIKKHNCAMVVDGEEMGRLLVPITYKQKPIAYITRKLLLPGKKFLTHGTRDIWNLDCGFSSVVLCEGVFDAIRVGRFAIAGLGSSLSDRQLKLIGTFFREVTLMFDADVGASQLVELGERLMNHGVETHIARLKKDDPASCDEKTLSFALSSPIALRDSLKIAKMLLGG